MAWLPPLEPRIHHRHNQRLAGRSGKSKMKMLPWTLKRMSRHPIKNWHLSHNIRTVLFFHIVPAFVLSTQQYQLFGSKLLAEPELHQLRLVWIFWLLSTVYLLHFTLQLKPPIQHKKYPISGQMLCLSLTIHRRVSRCTQPRSVTIVLVRWIPYFKCALQHIYILVCQTNRRQRLIWIFSWTGTCMLS